MSIGIGSGQLFFTGLDDFISKFAVLIPLVNLIVDLGMQLLFFFVIISLIEFFTVSIDFGIDVIQVPVDFSQIVVVFEAILSPDFKRVDRNGFALNKSPAFEHGNKMAKDLTKS